MHNDEEFEFNDELTDVDLAFVDALEFLGKDEHADDEYGHEDQGGIVGEDSEAAEGTGEGHLGNQGESEAEEGEPTGDASEDGSENPQSTDESDLMDLGELDPSQGTEGNEPEGETKGDHLEGGDTDSEIQDGESDLEFDDLDYDSPDEDEDDPDGGFDDGDSGQQTHFDESESQVEEDDGEGERGNSDEARESDAPIEHKSDSDDAELDVEDDPELKEPKGKGEQETTEDDSQEEDPEGVFEGIPEAPELCENHCEDNLDEMHDGECPHCTARLKRERELWGEIATDKNGRPILPGDRLRVVVPVSFMVPGTILSANVPNLEVDPIRVAQSTSGQEDSSSCWLSGRGISQFTGWHLIDNGPIWTFQKGKKIRFVEKISEPEFQGHGSNDMDGSQLDTEDMIEKLKEQMEKELGNTEEPELEDDGESETEEEEDDAEEDASEEDEMDDSETEGSEGERDNQRDSGDSDGGDDIDETGEPEEEEQHRGSSNLTSTQKARFESLTKRIIRKVNETFGNTLESIEVTNTIDEGLYVIVGVTITSRGSIFSMTLKMEKE